jgi:hypothetical protein
MTRNPYTPDEIFILLANVTDIMDIQRIADYIHENKDCYSPFDILLFNNSLTTLINVFIP